MLVGLVSMILLLSAPGLIISAYTNDAGIHLLAVNLLRMAALFVIIDAVREMGSFCLRAFKDTRFPFLVSCFAYWLITLPLGYWLGIQQADNPLDGTAGFWRAMIIGIGIASLLVIWRSYLTLRKPLPQPADPAGE
jgi:MATE family multidrug resistance protein